MLQNCADKPSRIDDISNSLLSNRNLSMNMSLTKYEVDWATGVDLATVGVALDENSRFGALRNQF